jgi:hypothetical protein
LSFPTNDVVGPIVHQLALVCEQVQGISQVYEQEPDTAPEDGSVMIPLKKFKVEGDTNGKLYLRLMFGVMYCKRRVRGVQDIPALYQYLLPFLYALTDWANQSLQGEAIDVNVADGGVTQFVHAGQTMRALVINVDVCTEYNIQLS